MEQLSPKCYHQKGKELRNQEDLKFNHSGMIVHRHRVLVYQSIDVTMMHTLKDMLVNLRKQDNTANMLEKLLYNPEESDLLSNKKVFKELMLGIIITNTQ